jgi:hypothetical protein
MTERLTLMAQLFHPSSKVIAKTSIIIAVLVLGTFALTGTAIFKSAYFTHVEDPREQTVPFSHQHHVSGLGISCIYCHTSVEESAFAGIPPTQTCMSCHSQVWTNSPMLAPVRESFRTNHALQWQRVNKVGDFAYFNHSIHVTKGIGCQTCHGQVDQMPLTWRAQTLYMGWCLDCHRDPAKFIRPREEVLNMNYQPTEDQSVIGPRLVSRYHVNTKQLTDCSICHR